MNSNELRARVTRTEESDLAELKILEARLDALLSGGVNPRSHVVVRLRRETTRLVKSALRAAIKP